MKKKKELTVEGYAEHLGTTAEGALRQLRMAERAGWITLDEETGTFVPTVSYMLGLAMKAAKEGRAVMKIEHLPEDLRKVLTETIEQIAPGQTLDENVRVEAMVLDGDDEDCGDPNCLVHGNPFFRPEQEGPTIFH